MLHCIRVPPERSTKQTAPLRGMCHRRHNILLDVPAVPRQERETMPIKTSFPPLPYLDPKYVSDHPANRMPEIKEDPYLPLSKREKARLEKEALEKAMAEWSPPHVLRSWETDVARADQRARILSLVLHPKEPQFYDLTPKNPYDSSLSRNADHLLYDPARDDGKNDFRQFAHKRLHLGYHRFHASHGEPLLPSEENDPNIPPEEICWIMEYTLNECNIIRRQIAHAMGLFPAAVDPENQFYDEEVAWRYERRLYCRCRRRNKQCVRPSHIEIFTSQLQLLP